MCKHGLECRQHYDDDNGKVRSISSRSCTAGDLLNSHQQQAMHRVLSKPCVNFSHNSLRGTGLTLAR